MRLGRGVDKALFSPAGRERALFRTRFGLDERAPVILYVGKLMPEKNVLLLARALAGLRPLERRFTLLACGAGALQRPLAELLGDRAVFAGVQPHELLRRLYASADLLAFPSATETFGQVVMEAACSGLPALVSARGGACQHVERGGEVGLVVAHDTPAEWAAALRTLLRDRERAARMGRCARRRAELVYPGWREVYREVVKPTWLAAARAHGRSTSPEAARLQARPLGYAAA